MSNHINRIIGPFSQIIPFSDLPFKGPLKDEELLLIKDGGVLVQDGKIISVGAFEVLAKEYPGAEGEEITQPAVLLPGFIDCHTHTCFAGTRSQDYALKLQGKTYIDIALEGGGIRRTVANTRLATEEALTLSLTARLNRHLAEGVTTIEVKSGYGLGVEQEIKLLTAIQQAANQTKASVISTCLAAHTLPTEYEGRSVEYLELMVNELLPAVKRAGLSNRVDIFIEETAFSLAEAENYLDEARAMGFALTVHADQFTPGGAALAARMGALSADHLEASGEADIRALAASETVAVVLPGASLGLGIPFAPARKLLDAGCCVAIASDWNPGSAPMGDLLLQAALLSIYEKLNFAETMAGLTFRAAKALGLPDRGTLGNGMRADMIAFAADDFREILYQQGKMKPFRVWTS